ncbi:hypothetical protein F5I97DRAFT_1589185 [Phlebopus sp. FC_14]|nr:hypothetical protein F5I97DRAFT_1589185 [Phlebopus sp. FC_14]
MFQSSECESHRPQICRRNLQRRSPISVQHTRWTSASCQRGKWQPEQRGRPTALVQSRKESLRPAVAENEKLKEPLTENHQRVLDMMSVETRCSRRAGVPHPRSRPLRARPRRHTMPAPQRTMLEHAWHTVLNSDPLLDSDEECPDEHVRLDYSRRMQVLNRLRGRSPTPEPELIHGADAPSLESSRVGGARRPSLA